MTNKEIAKKLGISFRTVERHMEHIRTKLKCCSRSDIVDKIFDFKPALGSTPNNGIHLP